MAFQLTELFVGVAVKTDAYKVAMRQVRSDLVKSGATAGKEAGDKTGDEMHKSLLSRMGVIGGALSVALGGLIHQGIMGAWSKLKETWSETVGEAQKMEGTVRRLKITFGDAAGSIITEATEMSESLGLSKQVILDKVKQFGVLAMRQGQTREEAAKFSMQMIKLAGDIKSFNGVSFEQAIDTVYKGAMRGGRSLLNLGISFSQHQIQQQALEMGYTKVNGAFRQTDLAMARVALMSKNLGLAQGDLASRSDSAGVAADRTKQVWANLYEEVGAKFLPAQKEWTFGQLRIALAAKEAFEIAKPYINSFAESMSSAWGKVKEIVLPVFNSIRSAITSFVGSLNVSISPLSAVLTAITGIGIVAGPMIVGAFTGMVAAAAPVIAAVGLLYGAFRLAQPYLIQFADMMLSYWPMIRATVISSIGTISEWWGNFTAHLVSAWESAQPTLLGVWDTLQSGFQTLSDVFQSVIDTIISNVSSAKNIVISAFSSIDQWIDKTFGAGTVAMIVGWGINLKEWVIDKVELAGYAFRNLGPLSEIAFLKAYQAVSDFGHNSKALFQSIASYALIVPEAILHAFNFVMEHGVLASISEVANGVKNLFSWLIDKIMSMGSAILSAAKSFGTELWNRMTGKKEGADPFKQAKAEMDEMNKGFSLQGVYDSIKKGAKDAEANIKNMREELSKASQAPPEDVSSKKINELYAEIANAEAERNKRLQDAGNDQKQQIQRNAEAQSKATKENEAESLAYFDKLLDKESRRRGRARYVPGEEKDAGARDVAAEQYTGGPPKFTDAAQFATNLRLSLLGGGKDYQERQTRAMEKVAENTDPKNAKPQPAVVA